MKNLQNVTILLAHYLETIQVEHLKIIVVSFLHVYDVCTKFERNLRHASVFHVDLTRNDPYMFCLHVCVYTCISTVHAQGMHARSIIFNFAGREGLCCCSNFALCVF